MLPDFDRGFDSELGLTFHEITPDGARAQLEIHDRLLQPLGIVHGGVYCAMIESLASVAGQVWLAANGGGTVVGVNNNTDFLRAIRQRHRLRASTPVHRGPQHPAMADDDHRRQDGRLVARGQVRLQNLEAGPS